MVLPHLAFLKNKKRPGTSLPSSFYAWFWRKIFLLLSIITWPNLIAWLPLLREMLGKICNIIACCEVKNLEINFVFLTEPFFYINKKSRQKLNILRTEWAFKPKLKTSFFKGLLLKQIKHFFWKVRVQLEAKANHYLLQSA